MLMTLLQACSPIAMEPAGQDDLVDDSANGDTAPDGPAAFTHRCDGDESYEWEPGIVVEPGSAHTWTLWRLWNPAWVEAVNANGVDQPGGWHTTTSLKTRDDGTVFVLCTWTDVAGEVEFHGFIFSEIRLVE